MSIYLFNIDGLLNKGNTAQPLERRRSERITINLRAERISGNETRSVFIENISENGINITIAPPEIEMDYAPGNEIDLTFLLPSAETVDLQCKIIWACKRTPPDGLTSNIGLEIINPPLKYIEWIESIFSVALPQG